MQNPVCIYTSLGTICTILYVIVLTIARPRSFSELLKQFLLKHFTESDTNKIIDCMKQVRAIGSNILDSYTLLSFVGIAKLDIW